MAAEALVAAQPVLPQAGELILGEGEADVVADGADVTQVVGDTFALGGQGTQEQGASRHRGAGGPFQGHAGGPGVSHGGVAGDAARQARQGLRRASFGDLFDALVHVAQAFLQVEDGLADRLEAEMPRLDDAGMDRPHGDLVHPFAPGCQEGVVLVRRCLGWGLAGGGEVLAQGIVAVTPGAMAGPAPGIGVVEEHHPEQVLAVTFRPVRRGEPGTVRAQDRRGPRHPGTHHQVITAVLEGHLDAQGRCFLAAFVRTPERHPAAAEVPRHRGDAAPVLRVALHQVGRCQGAGGAPADEDVLVLAAGQPFGQPVEAAHGRLPPEISRVAWSNHWASTGGMERPSQSTRARCR